MNKKVVGFLWLLPSNTLCLPQPPVDQNEGSMRYALDGMQLMMEGAGTFDDVLYDNLVGCSQRFDPELLNAENAQWQGMMDYAAKNGHIGDKWRPCDKVTSHHGMWLEFNCTDQEMGGMPIYEPCYYSSNIAYYHAAVEICQRPTWDMSEEYGILAFMRTFSYLAQGSAFWHGSETAVGGIADTKLNDLFAYIAYQAAVDGLEPKNSSILHELSRHPRDKSAVETTEELRDIYINQPVGTWENALYELDVPPIYLGFCAFVVVNFSFFMDLQELHDFAVNLLHLLGLDQGAFAPISHFCVEEALPVIDAATEDLVVDEPTKEDLKRGVLGMTIKLLYAVLWQEQLLPNEILRSDPVNALGAALLPILNGIANEILPEEEFPHFNSDFQRGVNVYPGEDFCNPAALPHAKWHLQTGIALGDVAHGANLISKIVASQGGEEVDETSDASFMSRSRLCMLAASIVEFLIF